MNIIILGVGKVGKTLVANFVNEQHDVVIIDQKRQVVESLVNSFDVKGLVGSGLERDVLIEAGVSECDMFIACATMDELNILACVLAKNLAQKRLLQEFVTHKILKKWKT